ncbi:hypothetical protein WHR41_08675 [Cladosporium halotolerans]|uniref:C2H2-type domain-containing protein n=1 Tax=Cladosporium halotolerans TaxID=1052096 RepID=A0AB34KHS5_9PEZI
MHRSTSPFDELRSANLTKTGRVSKATKGQPVHHCECGKTYTRAEHLRRHQQNHKSGSFLCDVDECGRAFHREDLLIRHKSKYHDQFNRSSEMAPSGAHAAFKHSDTTSPPSAPPLEDNQSRITDSTGLLAGSFANQPTQQVAAKSARRGHIPLTELRPSSNIVSFDETAKDIWNTQQLASSSWFSTPLHSLDGGSDTPESMYQQYTHTQIPPHVNAMQDWMSGIHSYSTSSPASGDSAVPTPYGQSWSFAPVLDTYWDHSQHTRTSYKSSALEVPDNSSSMLPQCRDILEKDDLMTPTTAPQASSFGPNQYRRGTESNEQRYLEAYWQLIHPSWPVIHKPSFELSHASPLLRAAMLTWGAHSTGRQVDLFNACVLHRRCLKVLKKRTINGWHTHRVCDVQAIFLLELFAVFRSRRPPFQLSAYFLDAYVTMARECDGLLTEMVHASTQPMNTLYGFPSISYDHESKQRLLAACYVLDILHATLFGRQRAEIPDVTPASLILPQPLHTWDQQPAQHPYPYSTTIDTQHFTPQPTLQQASPASFSGSLTSPTQHHDTFTSLLLLVYASTNAPNNQAPPSHPQTSNPSLALTTHLLSLATLVPVRALLATAGESWALAEKLPSRAAYAAAQASLRSWATSPTSSGRALLHAAEILHFHRNHLRTGLLWHEWSVYLAALVVWACAYVGGEAGGDPEQDMVAEQEVDGVVRRLREGVVPTMGEAGRVVLWVKGRVEKMGVARVCGVVGDAVGVLGRLGERGEEGGWF